MVDLVIDAVIAAAVLTGGFFTLVGSIGLLRFPDFFTRVHGPAKATTLGVGSLLVASALYLSRETEVIVVHDILIMVFLFMTAPVSAHLLCKTALHVRARAKPTLPVKRPDGPGWEWEEPDREG